MGDFLASRCPRARRTGRRGNVHGLRGASSEMRDDDRGLHRRR